MIRRISSDDQGARIAPNPPGQRHDIKFVDDLLAEDDIEAVIARRTGSKAASDHDRETYKWRHLVENFFCRIKEFWRIATGCEKTDRSFSAVIYLVGAVLWTR